MSTTQSDPDKERGFRPDPKVWDEMMQHTGKWVVASESKVIGFGDDLGELLKTADAEGVDAPLIFRVPEAGVGLLL